MPSQISTLLTRTQRDALQRAVSSGLACVRIPEPLYLSEWADRHFYLSAESSAIEGRWECLPFQTDILDCIGNDDIREIDWLKCARIGYTKCLMAAVGYFVEHKKRSGAIYQPTDSDAKEFSKSEIDPMLRDCKALAAAMVGDAEKRGVGNTQELKKFIGALLYIRGGHSARSYRRLTVDFVGYDELEGFERDVDGEGDPVSLGDKRVTNSPYPKSFRGSTPRLKADSLIYAEADRARHMFRYYVHCPECDLPQVLQFGQLRWDQDRPETVRYVCEGCEEHMHFHQLRELLDGGFWGTADGYRIVDKQLQDPDGLTVDWPRHIAFHIWAAYSPFITWRELVEEWLEAAAASKTGDHRKLQTFTNTRLAEPWEEAGEQVEYDALYARREAYLRPPKKCLLVTCAVDVQDNRLELELVGHGRGSESWGLEYRVIYGDPQMPEVWQDLEQVINQTFDTEDGRKLKVAGVMVDTGYLPDHVYMFWRRTRHPRVYCVKGVGGADRPIVASPVDRKVGKSKASVPLFLMGSDICKAIVYRQLQITERGEGFHHFPDSYGEDYFRALTAEKRVIRMRKGFERPEWIKVRPRNEALDIRAMTVALLEILNPVWDALDPDNTPPPVETRPDRPYIPHAHRHPRRRRR